MNSPQAPAAGPSRAVRAITATGALITVAAVAIVFGYAGSGANVDYSRPAHSVSPTNAGVGPPSPTPYRICGVPMFEQLPC